MSGKFDIHALEDWIEVCESYGPLNPWSWDQIKVLKERIRKIRETQAKEINLGPQGPKISFPKPLIPVMWYDSTTEAGQKRMWEDWKAWGDPEFTIQKTQHGWGLFAKKKIVKQKDYRRPYTGVPIPEALSKKLKDRYDRGVMMEDGWVLQGNIMHRGEVNEMSFANDPRGSGRKANWALLGEHKVDETGPHHFIDTVPLRDIEKGEEILIDYGEEFWKEDEE